MIVALLGLPGAGKTTLATALAELTGAELLLEPDEPAWPDFVIHPHENGALTSLTWFRSQRVPLYWKAAELSAQGRTVILDSYYDKWCVGWIGNPSFEWLIAPDDPYIDVARNLAAIDARVLPAADIVIVLEITKSRWREQLAHRGRHIDENSLFLRSHATQDVFVDTALARAPADGTKLILHRRTGGSPREEAANILANFENVT